VLRNAVIDHFTHQTSAAVAYSLGDVYIEHFHRFQAASKTRRSPCGGLWFTRQLDVSTAPSTI
jgi:hypothetical protein